MGIFRKLGGLAVLCTIAALGLETQRASTVDACGFAPTIGFETGDGATLPNQATGVYVHTYRSGTTSASDFVVVRTDAKGRKSNVAASLQKTSESGRYFLAFDRATKAGENYRVTYKPWSTTRDLKISEQSLQTAVDLKLQVTVDSSGGASLTAKTQASAFSGLWQYSFYYQGEQQNASRSSSSFLSLCKEDDGHRVGWRELSVEVVPGNKLELASIATVDVWVDCGLAKSTKHPSISKASHEHFMPSANTVALK